MTQFSVRKFSTFVCTHPIWCLAFALVMTVVSIWGIVTRLAIEMDVSQLLPEESQAARNHQAALNDFGHNFDFMLVVLEAKSGHEDQLRQSADMLSDYLKDPRFIREVTKGITPESLELDTKEGKARIVALLTGADWEAINDSLSEENIRKQVKDLRVRLNAVPSLSERQREQLRKDPLNIYRGLAERAKIKSGPLKLRSNLRDQYFMSADGEMLLLLAWPVAPATDLRFANDLKAFLEETRDGFYKRNPDLGPAEAGGAPIVNVSFFGAHWETIADSTMVQHDFYRTSIASFIAVSLLFIIAFRRPEALVLVAIPLTVGMVWTLGAASFLVGRLTQVTVSFAAILIGSGIDFSIHIYNRFLEEVRLGATNQQAVRRAMVETGPGNIAAALTAAVAFFGMTVTSFAAFRELGIVTGIGILCCLLSVLLVLPSFLVVFGGGSVGEYARRPMSAFGLQRFHFTILHYPRATLMAGLIVCGYLGIQGRNIEFNDDFRSLQQPSEEYMALRQRIMNHFQVPSNQIIVIVEGKTRREALEANDRLYRNIYAADLSGFHLVAVDSLRSYIPSPSSQKEQLERMARMDVDQVSKRILASAAEYKIAPWVFDDFINLLKEFKTASNEALVQGRTPIDLDTYDPNASDSESRKLNRIAKTYIYEPSDNLCRIVTKIYPPNDSTHNWLSEVPTAFEQSIAQGINPPPIVTGSVVIQKEIRDLILKDLAKTILVVLSAVFLYLIIYFESLYKAALAMSTVVIALMGMLGTVYLCGMDLRYLNILALPMVVGIGVDSGIHLLQRYYENDTRDMTLTITRTGRAVVITSLTTIFGFGSLALAQYRGIRELGIFAVIGVSFTLFAALLFLPAVLRLTERKGFVPQGATEDIG